jgi:hypothetical protein
MRFTVGAAVLATVTLAGCAGPEGNPDGQPYANEAGGVISVKPATIGTVSYDPYGKPAPFADMEAGEAAINPPSPLPLPLPSNPPRSH